MAACVLPTTSGSEQLLAEPSGVPEVATHHVGPPVASTGPVPVVVTVTTAAKTTAPTVTSRLTRDRDDVRMGWTPERG